DPAANHLAVVQLRQQVAHGIDWYREADADVALLAAVADDGGVHANHFAADVEERAAGVPWVDCGVGLEHVAEPKIRHREGALGRADDADRYRVAVAKRIADGDYPVAGRHLRRIAEFGFG